MIKYFFLVMFLLSYNLEAQNSYYTVDGKEKIGKTEVILRAQAMQEKISQFSKKPKFVNISIVDSTKTEDSIIYHVNFMIEGKEEDIRVRKGPLAKYLNQKLLSFDLQDLRGKQISLDQFNNKPTLINFWFTNCPPCIKELPLLNSLEEKYGDQFNFVAITFDSKEKVVNFLTKKHFNFKHLVEAKPYLDQLDIRMYPITAFLDTKGILQFADRSYIFSNGDFSSIEKDIFQKLYSLK